MSYRIGIVVIGRNEGERLIRCLESVRSQGTVMYVDSGSSDTSVVSAREMGAEVVELDMSQPFTAARARNAGYAKLRNLDPDAEFIQFVDGDACLIPGWLDTAARALSDDLELAIVCGRVSEQFPEKTIYHLLAHMEWDVPAGDVQSCGGIFMARAHVFDELGGFRDDVPAGEEPELCSRILQNALKIRRLAAPMAFHDIAMTHFRQWWRRQMRAGYGGAYTFDLCAGRRIRPFASQVRSVRVWTIAWPIAVASAAILGGVFGGVICGAICAMCIAMLVPLQIVRIAIRRARQGTPMKHALLYATLIMIAKWPQAVGQLRWFREKKTGIAATLVEHK